MACCAAAAERRERHRRDHRPVRAVEQPVDADHAQHRVDRARAVGGGVEVRQRIVDRVGRAAARGQPLGVQRREPGEHREHDAQARVRRPPPLRPRVPGDGHLGDIGGQRRKPRGRAGRRAGMDEERGVARRKTLERRAECLEARVPGEGARRHATRRRRPRPGARRPAPAPGRRARSPPHSSKGAPSSSTPVWKSSSSASASGSHSMPSGLDGAIRTRCRPSAAASAARSPGHARAGRTAPARRPRARAPTRRRGAAIGEGPCAAPGRRAGHPARGAGGCRRGAR